MFVINSICSDPADYLDEGSAASCFDVLPFPLLNVSASSEELDESSALYTGGKAGPMAESGKRNLIHDFYTGRLRLRDHSPLQQCRVLH